jgi:ADP-ribose pyrophosphatase YjhB (NUDIX family)
VTAHVVGADGATTAPGRLVRFGDDPAEVARAAGGLPADAPLTARDARTEIAVVDTPGGPLELHVDRLFYTPAGAASDAPFSAPPRPWLPRPGGLLAEEPDRPVPSLRRFASYGVVTDPAGRILLALIAPGFPGAGTWHLPGGGVDHGEDARAALRREIYEETGQDGGVGRLVAISHHARPGQMGPENRPTDIYAVWVFFHAHVAAPVPTRVTETAGSTADCGWFAPEDLPHLRLSLTARRALGSLGAAAEGR